MGCQLVLCVGCPPSSRSHQPRAIITLSVDPTAQAMPIERGHTLSHYRLIEKIGEGGMGVVWRVRDAKWRIRK